MHEIHTGFQETILEQMMSVIVACQYVRVNFMCIHAWEGGERGVRERERSRERERERQTDRQTDRDRVRMIREQGTIH